MINREFVSRHGLCIANGACRQFKDGMGPQAARETPGTDIGANLHDSICAIKKDEIDAKSHPEGMDCFAGNDPEPFASCETVTAKQPFAAIAAVTGELYTVSKLRLPGKIANVDVDLRRSGASFPTRQNRCEFECGGTHRKPSIPPGY
jgi:hypothetical protein